VQPPEAGGGLVFERHLAQELDVVPGQRFLEAGSTQGLGVPLILRRILAAKVQGQRRFRLDGGLLDGLPLREGNPYSLLGVECGVRSEPLRFTLGYLVYPGQRRRSGRPQLHGHVS
jgi:hypothetical protein